MCVCVRARTCAYESTSGRQNKKVKTHLKRVLLMLVLELISIDQTSFPKRVVRFRNFRKNKKKKKKKSRQAECRSCASSLIKRLLSSMIKFMYVNYQVRVMMNRWNSLCHYEAELHFAVQWEKAPSHRSRNCKC